MIQNNILCPHAFVVLNLDLIFVGYGDFFLLFKES